MTQLTPQGFIRTRLDERLAQLEEAMRGIFGEDINLDPDSPDGQHLGILAEAISNLDQLAEDVYHSFNPQSASGVALRRLVQLNGIKGIGGAYSTATIRCGGTQGTMISAGSLVRSATTTVVFETMADAIIDGSGFVDVPARATVVGAISAPIGTLTKIDTPIYGWQTATNLDPAVIGRDEETDELLRMRRRASTATPAVGSADALRGYLNNIANVLQADVFENEGDTADANGQAPHSIYCVVEGGAVQDILDAIWLKKGAGATQVGTTVGTAYDSRGNPHTVKFSRPGYVNVYVVVNLHKKAGWPTDGESRIKSAVVAWALANQAIGQEVIQSRLFDAINSVPGHSVDSLYIGNAPAPASTANIPVPFDGLAAFDVSRIVVNAS